MHLYNGGSIAMRSTMRNVTLFFLLLILPVSAVMGQAPTSPAPNATVERVEIAGIANQRLSADLRDAISKLNGQRYDAASAEQLANRIQSELPGMVAAPRLLAGTDATHVRVVFVVAPSSSAPGGPDSNVNSQYTVEAVEVKGLERSQYSTAIFEEMQQMVGQRLDNNLVEDLRVRLSSEVQGQYFIKQKIERGSMPEHVKIVYDGERTSWIFRVTLGRIFNGNIGKGNISISTPNREKDTVESVEVKGIPPSRVSSGLNAELQRMVNKQVDQLEIDHLLEKLKSELGKDYSVTKHIGGGTGNAFQARIQYQVELIPWLPYRTPKTMGAYHQKQGITFLCGGDEFIGKYIAFCPAFDGDSLTERYKGLSFALESRNLGTRRLGARLGFETYGVQWKNQTRRALGTNPTLPGLYRSREVLSPSLAFAFNRYLYVTGGAKLVELEMEGPAKHWRSVHEGVASIHYDSKEIEKGDNSYQATASYEVRTGARNIGSTFSFTRHAFDHSTTVKAGKHKLKLSAMGGKITGNAPLFERFTLGNTQTLRGWNKYDIDPLGGDRVWHTSAAYQFSDIAGVFIDQGAIWGNGMSRKTRRSVGLTIVNTIGIAMPLECAGHCGVTFFMNFKG
jgi:hypothetical protein